MEPIINDERELQEWLIRLGYQPILLSDDNQAIEARIKVALQSTRGKNFVTSESVYALH